MRRDNANSWGESIPNEWTVPYISRMISTTHDANFKEEDVNISYFEILLFFKKKHKLRIILVIVYKH